MGIQQPYFLLLQPLAAADNYQRPLAAAIQIGLDDPSQVLLWLDGPLKKKIVAEIQIERVLEPAGDVLLSDWLGLEDRLIADRDARLQIGE